MASRETDAAGIVQQTVYDDEDRPVETVDANGVTVQMDYDALGRLTNRVTVGAGTDRFLYTARGLTNFIDALGKTNWYVFDAAGRNTARPIGVAAPR